MRFRADRRPRRAEPAQAEETCPETERKAEVSVLIFSGLCVSCATVPAGGAPGKPAAFRVVRRRKKGKGQFRLELPLEAPGDLSAGANCVSVSSLAECGVIVGKPAEAEKYCVLFELRGKTAG